MTGSSHQDNNIENFVRENTRLIVGQAEEDPNAANGYRRIYKCKDCNKEYDSFQALGGHRAGHRTLKTETVTGSSGLLCLETRSKPKLHRCRICKKEFEIGQSLGGHMRKHWKERFNNTAIVHADSFSSSSSVASNSNGRDVFKYDLNLTPHENESINRVALDQTSSLAS